MLSCSYEYWFWFYPSIQEVVLSLMLSILCLYVMFSCSYVHWLCVYITEVALSIILLILFVICDVILSIQLFLLCLFLLFVYTQCCLVHMVIFSVFIPNVSMSIWSLILYASFILSFPYIIGSVIISNVVFSIRLLSLCLLLMLLVHIIIAMCFSWCRPVHMRMCSVFLHDAVLFLWQYIVCASLTLYCLHVYFHSLILFLYINIPWLSPMLSCLCRIYYYVYLEVSFAYRVNSSRGICSINNSFNLLDIKYTNSLNHT